MLKNGRPFTRDDNGTIDAALITERDVDDVKLVDDWIRENVLAYSKKVSPHSSYELKHMLEANCGLYLTNNEFKDAMLLAGFQPEDPEELNWHYRIRLRKEIPSTKGPFFDFVVKNYAEDSTGKGDFCRDMIDDVNFPVIACRELIIDYLESALAMNAVFDVFEELWKEFLKQ